MWGANDRRVLPGGSAGAALGVETGGVAGLRRGFQKSENADLSAQGGFIPMREPCVHRRRRQGPKMPSLDRR